MHHINHNNPAFSSVEYKVCFVSEKLLRQAFFTCFSPPQFEQIHNVFFTLEGRKKTKNTLGNDVHNCICFKEVLTFMRLHNA